MDKLSMMEKNLQSSIQLKQKMLEDKHLVHDVVPKIVSLITDAYQKKNKVLFCGNGGSAADAQHLAAELSGRYYYDRPPLFSEALHVNTSYLTAVANDYSYDEVFSRLLLAMGNEGDILITLSTSGNSRNILKALETAKNKRMTCIGFTGQSGGKMNSLCDIIVRVPSNDTPRIQEAYMLIGHTICEAVEKNLFPHFK